MKTHTPLIALILTCLFAVSARAQYIGTNDFSSGTGGGGQYSLTANIGTFTVEQDRLEYSALQIDSSRVLIMNSAANSAYTEDWTASLTLTNLTTPASGFNLISMQVFAAGLPLGSDYGFFNVGLYRTASGTSGVLFEKSNSTDGSTSGLTLTSYIAAESDLTDVLVRMSHNSSTKDITLGYSLDGGATYQDTVVFNPNTTGVGVSAGNWYAAPTDGYSFRILGRNSTNTVAGDLMYADSFSVAAGATAMSAVPEPSTYAAIAGLGALGLALWHRRRKAA